VRRWWGGQLSTLFGGSLTCSLGFAKFGRLWRSPLFYSNLPSSLIKSGSRKGGMGKRGADSARTLWHFPQIYT